jgi:carboxymethylenebutenolidase
MAKTQPDGFLAVPPNGKGRGVLVLHAWWGLNDTMKGICTRLSQAGFTAFAPDLYHGSVARTIPEAEALSRSLEPKDQQVQAEIAVAIGFLEEQAGNEAGDLTVMGFSMGAYYALQVAAADPDHIRSVVLFYGTGPADFSKSRAAYLGHFAENDPFEPPANVDGLEELLKTAGCPVTFYRYGGTGHWFFEPDRVDAYNRAAANLAWDRTVEFLKKTPDL